MTKISRCHPILQIEFFWKSWGMLLVIPYDEFALMNDKSWHRGHESFLQSWPDLIDPTSRINQVWPIWKAALMSSVSTFIIYKCKLVVGATQENFPSLSKKFYLQNWVTAGKFGQVCASRSACCDQVTSIKKTLHFIQIYFQDL